jgi:hypothetical protein
MMIATWGNEWRYRLPDGTITATKPAEGVLETDDSKLPSAGKYNAYYGLIWYPIFYDMDTMLGLDNVGYRNKNYFDEDTVDDVFNGDEILWKFVRDALPTHIAEAYNNFEEKNALRKDYLLPCFNANQANLANETFYNEDANYKYIDPYLRNMSGSRIFPAQGNRSLDREYFVENRLKYLAGKYVSEDHTEKDRFFFRMTYPKPFEGDSLTEEE